MQWSRADEHGWEPKGPPTLIDLRAALDASNNVVAWESEFFLPQATGNGVVPLIAATLSGLPADPNISPGNIIRNSNIPYKIAEHKYGMSSPRVDTFHALMDPHTRANAEYIRQRVLHGRIGCGS